MPRILQKRIIQSTPWVDFYEIQAELDAGKVESFYAIKQPDYITVVAETPSGRFAMVKQFRPAVGVNTYEFPAGTLEPEESVESACRREVLEETGHKVLTLSALGTYFPDTGRSMHRQHAFYARIEESPSSLPSERGISVEYYTESEIKNLIRTGVFCHQIHISVFFLKDLMKTA